MSPGDEKGGAHLEGQPRITGDRRGESKALHDPMAGLHTATNGRYNGKQSYAVDGPVEIQKQRPSFGIESATRHTCKPEESA